MEDVIGDGGRPRWIDYRMAFGTGQVLPLHVVARGDYDTDAVAARTAPDGGSAGSLAAGLDG